MITARMLDTLAYLEIIEEMDDELIKTIEDFGRAMNAEAPRLATDAGKHLLYHSADR